MTKKKHAQHYKSGCHSKLKSWTLFGMVEGDQHDTSHLKGLRLTAILTFVRLLVSIPTVGVCYVVVSFLFSVGF